MNKKWAFNLDLDFNPTRTRRDKLWVVEIEVEMIMNMKNELQS